MIDNERKIITHQPWVISQQASLGQEVTASWKTYHQSSKSQLEKIYKKSEFDPTTRFYLVEDRTVIGFVTCKIEDSQALVSPPIVQDDRYEEICLLFNHVIEEFKDRDVKIIRLTTSKSWGRGYNLVNDYNMSKSVFLFRQYSGKISDVIEWNKFSSNAVDIKEDGDVRVFDPDKDTIAVAELLASIIGYSTETAISILDQPNPMEGVRQTLSFVVSKEKQVVGWIRAQIIENATQSYVSLSPGYIAEGNDDYYRKQLLQKVLIEAKSLGISTYQLIVTAATRTQFDVNTFEKAVLDHEIAYYTLDLSSAIN